MPIRSALLSLLVVICACTSTHLHISWVHPSPVIIAKMMRPVYVDDQFDEADRADILSAVEEWNATLNGRLLLVPQSWDLDALAGDPNAISLYRTTDATAPRPPDLAPRALAWTNAVGGRFVWFIRDRIAGQPMRAIALHELGHVLGASDQERAGLLMSRVKGTYEPRCVDRNAAEDVARFLGVPLYALAWCEVTA